MVQLTLSAGHTHCAQVDANGNGGTTVDAGHSHQIGRWQVQPANGHVHGVAVVNGQAAPCQGPSASKPCNCGRK